MVMANYLAPEDDPVNYLPARINPNLAAQGRRMNLAERQQTSPIMQAGNVQFAKELASMGNRGAVPDLINRGLIANTAGLPVDMLNTVLQTLGLGSEQPLGGSDSIRRALEYYGLSSETKRPMLETLASLTPPRAVMGAARVAGQGAEVVGRAAAPVAGQALENYLVRSGGILPMDTWHGTPHRFPPTAKNPLGEFDASKIGTGEGAQAYGHGLYLAENFAVSDEYANRLSTPIVNFGNNNKLSAESEKAAKWIRDNVGVMQSNARHGEANRLFNLLPANIQNELGKPSLPIVGNLYKVDLPDEQIAKMLDWDKPLSQQSQHVQDVVAKMMQDKTSPLGSSMEHYTFTPEEMQKASGRFLYDLMGGSDVRNFKKSSQRLSELGIPGIRYLDQGSRAGGAGTSNFVVFDPKHMNIIGRE